MVPCNKIFMQGILLTLRLKGYCTFNQINTFILKQVNYLNKLKLFGIVDGTRKYTPSHSKTLSFTFTHLLTFIFINNHFHIHEHTHCHIHKFRHPHNINMLNYTIKESVYSQTRRRAFSSSCYIVRSNKQNDTCKHKKQHFAKGRP